MIEGISDAVQLVVLAACFALSLARALRERNSMWTTITCFYACMLLGNVYWFGYLVVFGDIPHYSYIAEMSWIAGYIFLLMLVVETDRGRKVGAPVPLAWVPVVLCVACCVYYIVDSGNILLNIVDNALMAAIGFFAVKGIVATPDAPPDEGSPQRRFADNRVLHAVTLAFVVVEQALWLSSCLWETGSPESMSPYIVLNYVLTLSYAAILASAWRSSKL